MERFLVCETEFAVQCILDFFLSCVNAERYICSDYCFRSLKHYEKLQEDANTLHCTLKECEGGGLGRGGSWRHK